MTTHPQHEVMKAKWARYSELPAVAMSAVSRTSEANEKKYPGEDWWWQEVGEHLAHAEAHVADAGVVLGLEAMSDPRIEQHLEHAIWRLAATLYKVREGRTRQNLKEMGL